MAGGWPGSGAFWQCRRRACLRACRQLRRRRRHPRQRAPQPWRVLRLWRRRLRQEHRQPALPMPRPSAAKKSASAGCCLATTHVGVGTVHPGPTGVRTAMPRWKEAASSAAPSEGLASDGTQPGSPGARVGRGHKLHGDPQGREQARPHHDRPVGYRHRSSTRQGGTRRGPRFEADP